MIKSASNGASSGALQNTTNAASNWPAKAGRKGARRHHPSVRDHHKPPYRHQLVGGTLNSAAPFSIAVASVGGLHDAKPFGFGGDLVHVPHDGLRRLGLLGHAHSIKVGSMYLQSGRWPQRPPMRPIAEGA
jgi:hypothetical protein